MHVQPDANFSNGVGFECSCKVDLMRRSCVMVIAIAVLLMPATRAQASILSAGRPLL